MRLSDVTPVPPGKLPGQVGTAINTLIGWGLTIGLAMCVLGAIGGWIAIGVGNNTERAEVAARGKKAVMYALLAASGLGLIFVLVNAFYHLGG